MRKRERLNGVRVGKRTPAACVPQASPGMCEALNARLLLSTATLLADLSTRPIERAITVPLSHSTLAVTKFAGESPFLWTTDATDAGTANTGIELAHTNEIYTALAVANVALINGTLDDGRPVVWATDGTARGTRQLFTGTVNGLASAVTADGGRAWWIAARDFGDHECDLWMFDASSPGPKRVKHLPFSFTDDITPVGKTVFLSTDSSVWRSDGRASGTRPVALDLGWYPPIVRVGGSVYASVSLDEDRLYQVDTVGSVADLGRWRLYRSGKQIGGSQITIAAKQYGTDRAYHLYAFENGHFTTRISPRAFSYEVSDMIRVRDIAYFADGAEVWRTDGTAAGTYVLATLGNNALELHPFGKSLIVSGSQDNLGKVWRVEANGAATQLAFGAEVEYPVAGYVEPPAVKIGHNRSILFTAGDTMGQLQLFGSLGSAASTQPLGVQTRFGADTNPSSFTRVGDRVVFIAQQQSAQLWERVSLWSTDGSGTPRLVVSLPGYNGLSSSSHPLLNLDDRRMLWSVSRHTDTDARTVTDLYLVDLVKGKTTLIRSEFYLEPVGVTTSGTAYYLSTGNMYSGQSAEIWKSDGTVVGTRRVAAIPPASDHVEQWAGAISEEGVVIASGGYGLERIFASDGTRKGTRQVKVEAPGETVNAVGNLITYSGKAYVTYSVLEGGSEPQYRFGALSISSRGAMTSLMTKRAQYSGAQAIIISGDSLFFAAPTETSGYAAYLSDGTSKGTRLVGNIPYGSYTSNRREAQGLIEVGHSSGDVTIVDSSNGHIDLRSEPLEAVVGHTALGIMDSVQLAGKIFFNGGYLPDASLPSQPFSISVGGTIRGAVYRDANGDGKRDAGEAGLQGVSVFIDSNRNRRRDASEPLTKTDGAGRYAIDGLAMGDHSLCYVLNSTTRVVGDTYLDAGEWRAVDVGIH